MAIRSLASGPDQGTLSGLRQFGALHLDALRHSSRLSSGRRVGQPGDTQFASLIGIGQRLDVQAGSLNVAARNVVQGAALLQTAQGGLSQTGSLLARARELAVQSANGTLNPDERAALDTELTQIKQQLDSTANGTRFNTQTLLDGTAGPVAIQAGATPADTVGVTLPNVTTSALGLSGASLATQSGASAALDQIDSALRQVNGARGQIAAQQSGLDRTSERLGVAQENAAASASRIQDADVAAEASRLALTRIRQQMTLALQAHRNVNQNAALRLLGLPG